MSNHKSRNISGIPASPGIGIGKVWVLNNETKRIHPEKIDIEEIDEHEEKYERAINQVINEHKELKNNAEDEEIKQIIEAQIQILKDPELNDTIRDNIKEKKHSVFYSIFSAFNDYIRVMEQASAQWLHERLVDIVSIRDQLIEAAKNRKQGLHIPEGSIILATEISPILMIQLSKSNVLGIVMEKGALTSHAVILSQSLGIPCVVGAHWQKYKPKNQTDVLLDGETGEVILFPDSSAINLFHKREKKQQQEIQKALKWAEKPNRTECGAEFTLRANVEFLEEMQRLSVYGAKGIGLLRTETILFQTTEFDVQEQVKFYSQILEESNKESVTIRLFDAGGDKLLENFEAESNPFLGWRGIRMLLDEEELLRKQLEAIYTTSGRYRTQIKLLIPMISRVSEIIELKNHIAAVQKSLTKKGIPFDDTIPVGIMIEVPSAALMAEELGKHCDFFSIGTNDLTQYTLAVDRVNDRISKLFQPNDPSVWKLINMAIQAASRNNIPIAVCGEMAAKPKEAACFLGLGIRELSMNTSSIPKVKSMLCRHSLSEMQSLAATVVKAKDIDEVMELMNRWL